MFAPCQDPRLCPDPPAVHPLRACDIQDVYPEELVHQTGISPAGPEKFERERPKGTEKSQALGRFDARRGSFLAKGMTAAGTLLGKFRSTRFKRTSPQNQRIDSKSCSHVRTGLVAATKCDDGIRMVALMHHLYAVCDDLSGSFPIRGGRIPPSLVPGGKITPADGLDRHFWWCHHSA